MCVLYVILHTVGKYELEEIGYTLTSRVLMPFA
jgi:hypothetical protein